MKMSTKWNLKRNSIKIRYLKERTQKCFLASAALMFLFVAFGTSRDCLAGLNLATGYSTSLQEPRTDSILFNGELTLSFGNSEAGLFYDHGIAQSTFNLIGGVGRIGFGPGALFVDAKFGFTTSSLGLGAGFGMGYRFTNLLAVRAGPRLLAGTAGAMVVGDLAIMLTF